MKKWTQPARLLVLLLAVSAVLMTLLGFVLKHTVAHASEQIQQTMAIAVPFVLLRGDVALDVEEDGEGPDSQNEQQAEEPQKEPDSAAGTETGTANPAQGTQTANPEGTGASEPNFTAVEESYFDTVLFIGDSRTVGLANYGRLGKADYFADVGMSMFNLFNKTVSDKGFSSQSLRSLLQNKKYETIYLMLGINEIGYPAGTLEKKLSGILQELKTLQPDASIILQANLAVTQAKAEKNQLFTIDKIRGLNQMMASYADNQTIYFLDENPYFTDESGYLKAEYTSDGVHPYAAQYKDWAAWIKDHALVK